MLKEELRLLYLEKRNELSKEELETKTNSLTDKLYTRIVELNIKDVFIFLPIKKKNEFDCRPLAKKLWDSDIRTHVPVSDFATKTMKFAAYDSRTVLEQKKYEIIEPSKPIYKRLEKAIVITPLLIADVSLNRVGYGGGFYDRFFSQTKGLYKIGVSFFEPIPCIEGLDKNDLALDLVVF